jgi:arylsulfatase A-like enzyme
MRWYRGSIGKVIAASLALWPLACRNAESRTPDVLLITIDTLRADHLGTYGFAYDTSPEIDALASSSVVFERAIAASSRTVPAHASMMTSRNIREHSVGYLNGGSTLRGALTLAQHFRDAGYATAGFIGNILLTRSTGLGVGFDVFDDDIDTPELNRPHVVERLAGDTTARALQWLAEPREDPFFLWVHYQDPHGPYTPPTEIQTRFDIPATPGEKALPAGESNQAKGGIPPYQRLPGLELLSQYKSRYAGEIFHADRFVGQLLHAVGPEAVVLLTSDHGESFGESGRFFGHTYASTPDVAHVPFVLRAPTLGVARRNEIVSHVDVLPTLLDLAGLPVPADVRGVALGKVVRGESMPPRVVYCDIGSQLSAYTEEGFVQIHGLEHAWGGDVGVNRPWRRFAWSPGTKWKLLEQGRGPLPDEVQRYVASAEPMQHLPPPDPALTEQLRALGYAD